MISLIRTVFFWMTLTVAVNSLKDAGHVTIAPAVLNGAGQESTSSNYSVVAATGEDGGVGDVDNSIYGARDGFVPAAAVIPGDMDDDGDIDLLDFGRFVACFRGPRDAPPPNRPNCLNADLDSDGDVDLDDFRILVGNSAC